jgi:hypothetical protein
MSDTTHLISRKGAWYYHRRAPTRLVERFGRRVVKQNLDATSKKATIRERAVLDLKYGASLHALEREADRHSPDQKAPVAGLALTEAAAVDLVGKYGELSVDNAAGALL